MGSHAPAGVNIELLNQYGKDHFAITATKKAVILN